jgi:hypothetical protein
MSECELKKFEESIREKIYSVRGFQVMLDRDLAELYGVETKYLNRVMKRNSERFPGSFCFQLNETEYHSLRCQFVTIKNDGRGQHRKYLEQYEPVEVLEFDNSHDRFIVIDEKIIYHLGASLKDLGKKWFGFSKMDIEAVEMLTRLGNKVK